MNNDIVIQNANFDFNYRIAIVIRNNNKILAQKDDRVNYYTLPGGRCELGESSIHAAIRELKEETGLDSEFVKPIGVIENFFVSNFSNKEIHELLIIHEIMLKDKSVYHKDIINNIEDKKDKKLHLKYFWIDTNQLNKENFKPEILIEVLEKNEFQHYISKD